MTHIQKIQFIILAQLLITEIIFLLLGQYLLALAIVFMSVIYTFVIEAYNRGLSKLNIKTKPAEVGIEMVREIEKQNEKVAKDLAKTINPESKPSVVRHNTELIVSELDEAFKLGLQIGGYDMNGVSSIQNVKLEKDKSGKITGVVWDETY